MNVKEVRGLGVTVPTEVTYTGKMRIYVIVGNFLGEDPYANHSKDFDNYIRSSTDLGVIREIQDIPAATQLDYYQGCRKPQASGMETGKSETDYSELKSESEASSVEISSSESLASYHSSLSESEIGGRRRLAMGCSAA